MEFVGVQPWMLLVAVLVQSGHHYLLLPRVFLASVRRVRARYGRKSILFFGEYTSSSSSSPASLVVACCLHACALEILCFSVSFASHCSQVGYVLKHGMYMTWELHTYIYIVNARPHRAPSLNNARPRLSRGRRQHLSRAHAHTWRSSRRLCAVVMRAICTNGMGFCVQLTNLVMSQFLVTDVAWCFMKTLRPADMIFL